MEFQFKGANCVQITTKSGTILTDPNLAELGLKAPSMSKVDICLLTDSAFKPTDTGDSFVIDSPGEYEVKDYAIRGLYARSHLASDDKGTKVTIYRVSSGELNVAVFGHIYPSLSEEQLEAIGVVDVMIVPVGGNGYTLDPTGAAQLVKKVDPKVVIPTHYADPAIDYPVNQLELAEFIKELGAPTEQTDKLKLKRDTMSEILTVWELTRS
jgi:L-ascorbate metabolism protein UlaG (beta-lactamase superfamily)